MPNYNGRIFREEGGSAMTFASGASLNFAAGAAFAGTFGGTLALGGSLPINSGAIVTVQSGGCATFNLSGAGAQTVAFSDGTLTPTISVGRNVPTHTTSPGSLYIRSDGSVSNWYYNISSGATGSVWRAAASG